MAIDDADGGHEDPLVAELRVIEECPRNTAERREALWARLSVLRNSPLLFSGILKYDEGCTQLAKLLREAIAQLADPRFREAAVFLMRLDSGSATESVAKLNRLASASFPGRRPKTTNGELQKKSAPSDGAEQEAKVPKMKRDSFTRKGATHDRVLEALAYVLRQMEEDRRVRDSGETAIRKEGRDSAEEVEVESRHYNLSLHIKLCFLEKRRPVWQDNTRLIRASVDGRDEIRLVFAPYQRDLEVIYGGEATYEPKGGGHTRAIVRLADPPMKLGETRLLVTRSRYIDDSEPVTWLRHAPGRKSVDLLVLGVQFSPDVQPARVWWWDETHPLHTPTLFTPDKQLTPNNLHYVERHFMNSSPYLTCGIAWEWD